MCLQLQYLGQHLCKINNPPHVSIHPSILHRHRQAEWRGEWGARGKEEYLVYRSLCFAGQQLIWNRPPNISAHTYRNERSSSASLLPPLSPLSPLHSSSFPSSAGNMICISSPVPSPASSASLDLICMRALACLTLSCCQPCSGSVSYFTFISAPSSSPSSTSSSSRLCFCLFMSCPSGGFTSNCCVGNAKRKVRIGPISRISSLSPLFHSPYPP